MDKGAPLHKVNTLRAGGVLRSGQCSATSLFPVYASLLGGEGSPGAVFRIIAVHRSMGPWARLP